MKPRTRALMYSALVLICLLFLLPFAYTKIFRTNADFSRHRLEYTKVIDSLQKGEIACDTNFTDISKTNFPEGVQRIYALRKPDGAMLVMFATKFGFPLHHEGYLYEDCKTNVECISNFNALKIKFDLRPVMTNWYYFSG